ncbi:MULTISPECIES: YtxH domain-containing protein [Staphylococcus]|uniref:YtxH domain-containing protein n=1 Tax=Staphylococcus pasteuri_A TaxID=3062664 RepID=A0AAW7YV87_9STAP|nr:YtxH domain-containing protein [Staphylococcus pasteuri_A]MDO6574620.1 YtxH domain-containing protein [Staphylococcus pasteuri_A]
MFKYYNLAFKNAKPQNLKAILFTLISFIVIFLVGRVAMAMIGQQMMQLQMMMQFGQPAGPLLIPIIGVAVLVILLFIFLGYQLLAGAINVISRAIRKDKVKFSDLFIAFKKGHYAKSLLLALITILMIVIMSVILYFVNKLLNLALSPLVSALQGPLSKMDNPMPAYLTFQIAVTLIVGFITSIFYWFFFVLIINYTAAYTENPKQSAMTSVKDGFKAIKNGHKTWLKFFIGILLINLLITIITRVLVTLVQMATGSMSQTVAQILLVTLQIIVILVTLFIYYALLMGIVQYFIRRGEKVTTNSKKNKANKAVANKDTNNKTTKTQDLQDTTKDKVDQHSSDLKDNAKSTTQDSKKELNDKATQHKDDLSNSTTSHKDNLEETAKDTIDNNNPNNK